MTDVGTVANRVAKHRARMKARGYKEVRYWVPDLSSAEFAERIRQEMPALNAAARRDGAAQFLDEVQAETLAEW
ncbi:MAG: antitoxin MazE family protein [Actinomycetia bacterium]|nr:antitoxin MazE family protein [Actinomycetes bacterium]